MQNSKLQFKIKNLHFLVILFSFSFLFLPSVVWSVTLYLMPQTQTIYQGDTFLVEIRLDTAGEEINTVQVSLNYPSEKLERVDFSKGNSILILWPQEPGINQKGEINFIGGVPGGFNGQGFIGKIIFRAVSAGLAEVNFRDDSKVLLNDGKGTLAKLTTEGTEFQISSTEREIPKNEWAEEINNDKIPPEPFEIKIYKNPEMFEGKYFIVFSTIDKQTGLDYFEIKEGDREWRRGKSPYLLEDQALRNKISVKAVDKAGNERIAEIIPPKKPFPIEIIILILIDLGVIYWLIKKIKARKSKIK